MAVPTIKYVGLNLWLGETRISSRFYLFFAIRIRKISKKKIKNDLLSEKVNLLDPDQNEIAEGDKENATNSLLEKYDTTFKKIENSFYIKHSGNVDDLLKYLDKYYDEGANVQPALDKLFSLSIRDFEDRLKYYLSPPNSSNKRKFLPNLKKQIQTLKDQFENQEEVSTTNLGDKNFPNLFAPIKNIPSHLLRIEGKDFFQSLINIVDSCIEPPTLPPPPEGERKKVYLSYHPADSSVAENLMSRLESSNIEVTTIEDFDPGSIIPDEIKKAIKKTDFTVCIVSKGSLLSPWNSSEVIQTFEHENVLGGTRFMACYLDQGFQEPDFSITMTKQIDDEIDKRKQSRQNVMDWNIDAQNLTSEISRLTDLRNNAGKILERLGKSHIIDISESSFEDSVTKLIEAIKKPPVE